MGASAHRPVMGRRCRDAQTAAMTSDVMFLPVRLLMSHRSPALPESEAVCPVVWFDRSAKHCSARTRAANWQNNAPHSKKRKL
jgi:hypothetical protein